mgnify:FL=1
MRKRSKKNSNFRFGKSFFPNNLLWYVLLILIVIIAFQWRLFFKKYSKLAPTYGGIYSEKVIGNFKNTNPLSDKSTNFDKLLQKLIYSGLIDFSLATGQYEPALATFRVSGDSLLYTLTIKDSAQFSNGESVTADDVLFTFQDVIS